MSPLTRRDWLATAATGAAAGIAAVAVTSTPSSAVEPQETSIGFGLVTYMWGAEWDLPTLLANCKKTGALGVELRTTHAHKVEPSLTEKQRSEVQQRFADSGVTLVGLGSNERFDHPDPAKLKQAIEATKEYIRLSHDVGGSGVKVKPDSFQKDVPHERTIEQIGKALNELGEYATGFGQQVRLEVHGGCAELPTIKAIMDVAKDDNVAVCWNSNPTDLKGDGLEKNFTLVSKRFGQTCHVHELDSKDYPYPQLFKLLVQTKYEGWVLLEASSKRENYVTALGYQRKLFDQLLAEAAKA
jgi:sugar phosphate isomerase/epimerase